MKDMRVLSRIVTWTGEGIWYEADQRHAELIVKGLGVEEDSKGVVTPGVGTTQEEEGDDEELDQEEATRYRALAARANYLAQDRPDIQYSTKALCRDMAKPTKGGMRRLKRLA
eukprot:15114427-Alexandrium_andersonii.AAC.1